MLISGHSSWLHLHHLMPKLLLSTSCPQLRVLNPKIVALSYAVVVYRAMPLQAHEIRHFRLLVDTRALTIDEALAHDTLTDATQSTVFWLLLGMLSLRVLLLLLLLDRRR